MSWGEHRWLDKKWGLYDESVKVPLWIKVPGVPGRTEAQPVVNVDFAASFAEWAGVLPQSKVDGYSLVSLLNNPAAPWPEERLLEYLGISGAFGVPERRFRAVHTGDYVYAEYDNGDREFYDLQADPYQLNNSVSDPNYSSVIDVLKKVLAAIKGL
jgi:arylsulfatase A-like enzyme